MMTIFLQSSVSDGELRTGQLDVPNAHVRDILADAAAAAAACHPDIKEKKGFLERPSYVFMTACIQRRIIYK